MRAAPLTSALNQKWDISECAWRSRPALITDTRSRVQMLGYQQAEYIAVAVARF